MGRLHELVQELDHLTASGTDLVYLERMPSGEDAKMTLTELSFFIQSGLFDFRGNHDASGNTFPTTGGSGTAGAILKGDVWYISVAGTLGGVAVKVGDMLFAKQDTPGATASNWSILETNIGFVPENVANKVTSISAGSTDAQYGSAKLLYDQLASKSDLITGEIRMYSGVAEPSGWKFCNGQALSRTTYATLYALITSSKGEFTVTIAAPGLFTLATHGLVTGDCIELTTDGALPTGLSVNTNYWVIKKDANEFWLATTMANAIAGTKITTSGTQSGVHSLRFCPFGISTSANFLAPDMRGRYPKGVGVSAIANDLSAYPTGLYGQMNPDYLLNHEHSYYGVTIPGSNDLLAGVTADVEEKITTGWDSPDQGVMGANINEPPSLCVNFIIKT